MKKYEIMKLPEYDASYSGNREDVSIHTNHKGSLMKLSIDQNINFLAVVDFKEGKPARGNHYHKVKDEFFYLLAGKIHGYFKDLENGEVEKVIIESGTLIRIKPMCAHAFSTIEEGYGIEYSPCTSEEMTGDSFPETLIE